MAKQIARLLKATIEDTSDLKQIAKKLAAKGRGNDTMLAHITPKEAKILKKAGGSGTVNPNTGLLEFYDEYSDYQLVPEAPSAKFDYYQIAPETQATQVTDRIPQEYPSPGPAAGAYDVGGFEGLAGGAPDVSAVAPAVSTSAVSPGAFDEQGFWFGGYANPIQQAQAQQAAAAAAPPDQTAAPAVPIDYQQYAEIGPSALQKERLVSPTETYQPEQEKSLAQKAREYLTSADKVGVTPLERLGIAGLSAVPGITQARRAQAQGQQAKRETQALAAPYRARADELLTQAKTGQLSASEQQQIQAMQARVAQDVATRGGAGAQQAMNQLESFRQQLLANKYQLGLQISNISDQIAIGAIRAGLQADQYVDQLTSTYFNNALRMAMSMGQPQVPQVVYAPRA